MRKLSLEPVAGSVEAVLLYRYLSEYELAELKNSSPEIKYYVLPHRLFGRDYIKNQLLSIVPQAVFIADYSESSSVQTYNLVKNEFNTKNIFVLKSLGLKNTSGTDRGSQIQLPVIILFLLKIFMNPVNELKRFSVLLRYSNLRILRRVLELFLAADFVFNAVIFKSVRLILLHSYYKSNYLVGILKVILIKSGFAFRHVLLMTGFKSYGFAVDRYYQMIRPAANFIYLRILDLLQFLYYRVLYFLYYKFFYFLYYTVLMYFFRYRVRHAILITGFKSYGLIYDICMATYRFGKLKLMFPFFKIYWFCVFQYNKRIKKYIA